MRTSRSADLPDIENIVASGTVSANRISLQHASTEPTIAHRSPAIWGMWVEINEEGTWMPKRAARASVIALIVFGTATAHAEGPGETLKAFGMVGTWSPDCALTGKEQGKSSL